MVSDWNPGVERHLELQTRSSYLRGASAAVLLQAGAFFWPALLRKMSWRPQITRITSNFYGAYMLSEPFLVTATDRINGQRIYVLGVGCTVRSLAVRAGRRRLLIRSS